MAWCPNCEDHYDEDNDTQPCCGGCGYPITCDGPSEKCSDLIDEGSDEDEFWTEDIESLI